MLFRSPCGSIGKENILTEEQLCEQQDTGLVGSDNFCCCETNTINKDEFCGTSTYGYCETNNDCKEGGCTGQICHNETDEGASICDARECYSNEKYGLTCQCINNECQWK